MNFLGYVGAAGQDHMYIVYSIYVHMYISIYVYMYVYVYIYVYVCKCMYVYVCVYIYVGMFPKMWYPKTDGLYIYNGKSH